MIVPQVRAPEPGSSLDNLVAEWMEQHLVFGPGDLRGQPRRLDDEKRAPLWRHDDVLIV